MTGDVKACSTTPDPVRSEVARSCGDDGHPKDRDLPVTAYGRAVRARDRLRTYLRDQIDADTGGAGTVMAALHTARGPQGEQLTDDELEIELLHFFFAAHGG
jgi:cytochrome P450